MDSVLKVLSFQGKTNYLLDPFIDRSVSNKIYFFYEKLITNIKLLQLYPNFRIDPDKLHECLDSETSCIILNQVCGLRGLEQPINQLYETVLQVNVEYNTDILLIVDATLGAKRCQTMPRSDILIFNQYGTKSFSGSIAFFIERARQILSKESNNSQQSMEELFIQEQPSYPEMVAMVESQNFIKDLDDGLYIKDFNRLEHLQLLTSKFFHSLKTIPDLQFFGINSQCLEHNRGILCFAVPEKNLSNICTELDKMAVYIEYKRLDELGYISDINSPQSNLAKLLKYDRCIRVGIEWYIDENDIKNFITLFKHYLK